MGPFISLLARRELVRNTPIPEVYITTASVYKVAPPCCRRAVYLKTRRIRYGSCSRAAERHRGSNRVDDFTDRAQDRRMAISLSSLDAYRYLSNRPDGPTVATTRCNDPDSIPRTSSIPPSSPRFLSHPSFLYFPNSSSPSPLSLPGKSGVWGRSAPRERGFVRVLEIWMHCSVQVPGSRLSANPCLPTLPTLPALPALSPPSPLQPTSTLPLVPV